MSKRFSQQSTVTYLRKEAGPFINSCFPFFKEKVQEKSQFILCYIPENNASPEEKFLYVLLELHNFWGPALFIEEIPLLLRMRLLCTLALQFRP